MPQPAIEDRSPHSPPYKRHRPEQTLYCHGWHVCRFCRSKNRSLSNHRASLTRQTVQILVDLKVNDTPKIRQWVKIPGNLTKLSKAVEKKLKLQGITLKANIPVKLESELGYYILSLREPKKAITVVFTFDDGPHIAKDASKNFTAQALQVLKTNTTHPNTKGAFFVQTHVKYRGASETGKALIKKIHEEGHVVGIHTGSVEDHEVHTTRLKKGELKKDLKNAKAYLDGLGIKAQFVRPPGGLVNKGVDQAYEDAGLKKVLWNVDSYDSHKGYNYEKIQKNLETSIATEVKKGSTAIIVLFHELDSDTRGHIGQYIDHINDALVKSGYEMKTPKSRKEVITIFQNMRVKSVSEY